MQNPKTTNNSRLHYPAINGFPPNSRFGNGATSNHPSHKLAAQTPTTSGFDLEDVGCFGCQLRSTTPKFVIGLGGTGSQVVHNLMLRVLGECGSIPAMFEYLMVDADAPDTAMDCTRFVRIGNDGVGTDPRLGLSLIHISEPTRPY